MHEQRVDASSPHVSWIACVDPRHLFRPVLRHVTNYGRRSIESFACRRDLSRDSRTRSPLFLGAVLVEIYSGSGGKANARILRLVRGCSGSRGSMGTGWFGRSNPASQSTRFSAGYGTRVGPAVAFTMSCSSHHSPSVGRKQVAPSGFVLGSCTFTVPGCRSFRLCGEALYVDAKCNVTLSGDPQALAVAAAESQYHASAIVLFLYHSWSSLS